MTQTIKCAWPGKITVDGLKLSGVALPYGQAGNVQGRRHPVKIMAGAFGDVGKADVVLNVQHDATRPLARTTGDTLTLTDAKEHLAMTADLPDTRDAQDTVALVASGVLAGLSIEADPVQSHMADGVEVVTRARLTGLAVVDRPAFQDTTVQVAAGAGGAGVADDAVVLI